MVFTLLVNHSIAPMPYNYFKPRHIGNPCQSVYSSFPDTKHLLWLLKFNPYLWIQGCSFICKGTHTHTHSHLSIFLWVDFFSHCLSGVLPHPFRQSCHGDQLLLFFYIHTLNASTIVLSFVFDWLIFSAGGVAAVLQSVDVVCWSCGVFTDSPRWVLLVRGWHTQSHHPNVFLRLMPFYFHNSPLCLRSASLFPNFYPSFLTSSPLFLSVNLVISPPTKSLSHVCLCAWSRPCVCQCVVGEGCCC